MVIDTSALVAILKGEPDFAAMLKAIHADPVRLVSAATVVEASIVAVRERGEDGGRRLDELLAEIGAEIVPVTADHARLAREGFVRFGKGRDRAGLNFGDCFSYALARASGHPLLFKGDDFTRTDVAAAS